MEKKLWSINGDQGRAWQQVNVTIPANSFKFQVNEIALSKTDCTHQNAGVWNHVDFFDTLRENVSPNLEGEGGGSTYKKWQSRIH